ncbi:hypothetical protein ACI6QG_08560 [Roseococcus sp. DSY-14]|uniref:hypothetical protein n=1 Tax=Roseococcus sp. DSY-14 TaxID=3369650 RepID=UPI00387B346F
MTPLLLLPPLAFAALLLTIALQRALPSREAAMGLSMLLLGLLLHATTALDRWWVVGLVAAAQAMAAGVVALRVRRFGR